jgi:glycosyltransferase involved in cell wall biosynthesis
LQVLAVEPFYGGSHRAFLDGIQRHSRHRWDLITGKPVHWKWRSRSATLELAVKTKRWLAEHPLPDIVLASDMLDLPGWRGMFRDSPVGSLPAVVYFHESQWTYPLSAAARPDFHFGYTNLLSALAADACWFNSEFHRDEFLTASRAFVRRMPDSQDVHDFERLTEQCDVLPPGFDPPLPLSPPHPATIHPDIRIGWVSRWEHDKRPDRLLSILQQLDQTGIGFQLVLAGPRPTKTPQALAEIRAKYAKRILEDRYATSREDYWRMLQSMDVVISTAEHEFFGIAVCEAVWAGAVPVLPRRLSYPELVTDESLYDSTEQAAALIARAANAHHRRESQRDNRRRIANLRMQVTVPRIDQALQCQVKQDQVQQDN